MPVPHLGDAVPRELADQELVDASGARVRLGAMWRERPCLFVFLRHFGCVGCAEEMYELAPRLHELERAGVRTILVGNGSPAQRAGFVERHALDKAPVEILTDPTLAAYRALSLVRSAWATVGPRALIDTARALAAGHPHRPVEGDALQQGGVLLADTSGRVRLYHRSRSIGDHPPASDLVEAALRLAVESRGAAVHV
jgi:peroxiredoxin